MSDPLRLQSDWHRLGAGLSVRFSFSLGRFDAEWKPGPPTQCDMARVLPAYRLARDAFLDEMADQIGAPILCVELPT